MGTGAGLIVSHIWACSHNWARFCARSRGGHVSIDGQTPMDIPQFVNMATRLWGERYGGQAAAALGVSRRAVYNYATGARPVPAWMAYRMRAHVAGRLSVLQDVWDELDAMGAPPLAPVRAAGPSPAAVDHAEPDYSEPDV
jgi:hypothetical protein